MAVIGANKDVSDLHPANETDRILSDLLPEARGKGTLIGGTIQSLDHIRDSFVIHPFDGNDMVVLFDGRTRVYRDGIAASPRDLQPGERVYADTALAGKDIFARSIRVSTQGPVGQSNGQVVSYDASSRELAVRDAMASESVKFLLAPNAVVLRDSHAASPVDLRAGSLVTVKFTPSTTGPEVANEISILATPGTAFVFTGRVSHLDLRTGLLVLIDPRDHRTHDVHFDSTTSGVDGSLREGVDVIATATFDGARYTASSIVVNPPRDK